VNIRLKIKKIFQEAVMSGKLIPLYYVSLLVMFAFTGGCVVLSPSSRGLQKRMEVDQLFDSGTSLADHTYYTEGSRSAPNAIIAISNDFQLQTKLWFQRDWTSKDLAKVVFSMQIEETGFCTTDGGVLIAPDGQQIGVWYSKKDIGTIRQPALGVVEVYPFRYGPGSPCGAQALRDRF
jgi:hypothetical protein